MAEITTRAPAILQRARELLAWRKHFRDQKPHDQEAMIQQRARMLAVCGSEIGMAAVRIGDALDALLHQVGEFIERWPDSEAAETAELAALAAAGLDDPPKSLCDGYDGSTYAHTAEELGRWLPLLEVMAERLEECERPDTATNREEWERP